MNPREELERAAAAELARIYSGVRRDWQRAAPEVPVEAIEPDGRVIYLRNRKRKAS